MNRKEIKDSDKGMTVVAIIAIVVGLMTLIICGIGFIISSALNF